MKKRNMLLLMLVAFVFSVNLVGALEVSEGWIEYESGTTVVEVDKLQEFEEKLAYRVNGLNRLNLDIIYRYQIEVNNDKNLEDYKELKGNKAFDSEEEALEWSTSNKFEIENWLWVENAVEPFKIDQTLGLIRFETEEEAINAKNEFDMSVDEGSSNVIINKVRDEAGDVTVVVENNQKFDTREEAEKVAEGLRENTSDYVVTVEVIREDPVLVDTDVLSVEVVFDTREEAENYVTELKADGYTVEAEIKEIYENASLEQKYEELKEAEDVLADFVARYPETSIKDIEVVRDASEDKTVTVLGTDEYFTEEEALEVAMDLEVDNDEQRVVTVIRKITKDVVGSPESVESEQFDTVLEAQAYIDSLAAQGYDVSDLEIKLVSFEETIWKDEDGVVVKPGTSDGTTFTYNHFDITLLTEFTKIDALGNETTVNGTIAIDSVSINNKNIVMEGPTEDPNVGYMEYTSKERFRLSVTNKSLVEISGTVTFEGKTLPFTIEGYLSESQNVCGGKGGSKGFDLEFESVTIINNKVVIDSNIVNKYKVVGSITDTIQQDVWYVDVTTTTKGYDYLVKADGVKFVGFEVLGIASKDNYKDVYSLMVEKTTLDYDYEVKGTGNKTYYDVVSKYVRLVDVNWIVEYSELGKGGDVEVLPPQTGVNDNSSLVNVLVNLMVGILIVIKKLV